MGLSGFVRGLVVGTASVAVGLSVMASANASAPVVPTPPAESAPSATVVAPTPVVNLSGAAFAQIRSRNSNARIETEGASVFDGANLLTSLSTSTTYNPAQWVMVPVEGTNVVSFVNRNSGRCMDVPFLSNGTKLVQWACHGGTNQRFRVTATATPGWFTLTPLSNTNFVVQIAGCGSANALSLIISFYDNKTCAEWRFEPV